MTKVIIRAVELTDAKSLQEIYSQNSLIENMLQFPAPSLLSWQNRISDYPKRGGSSFVAEIENKVVGELVIYTQSNPRLKHSASLAIVVDERYAGQGVGQQLMQFCQDYTFNWLAIIRLELEVFASNTRAIQFYQRLGFEIEGCKRKAAFKQGHYQDVMMMAKLA